MFKTAYKNYSLFFSRIKSNWLNLDLKKVIGFIYGRKSITVIVTAFLLVLFNNHVIDLIDSVFVIGLLDQIKSNTTLDYLFFLIFLLLSFYIVYKAYIRFKPSFFQSYFLGVIVIQYLYHRFQDNPYWTFEAFSFNWLSLCYIDLIALFLLFPITKFILFHINENEPKYESSLFVEDLPLDNGNKESLGRDIYAKQLARLIYGQKFEKAFSLGILGPWGAGKTSFINMMKDEMDEDRTVLVDFNPFYNNDDKSIIEEFFKILSQSVKEYSSELSVKFKRYGEHVVNAIGSKSLQLIYDTLDLINNEKVSSLQDHYSKINEILIKLKKQIVISVDDVDRLSSNEIIQLLKLIRNTANFHNTVYIISLDKEYLISSLKEDSGARNRKFIEKFFQYEFILPPFNKHKVRSKFFELISGELNESMEESVKQALFPNSLIHSTLFDRQISSYRDAIKLANIFKFDLQLIKGEVNLGDLIRLSILKSKYSSIYLLLANDIEGYLERKTWGNIEYYVQSRYDTKGEPEKNGKKVLIYDVSLRKEEFGLSDYDIDEIEEIIDSLFSEGGNQFYGISHLSIKRVDKIDTYINLKLLGGGLSENEFIEVFSSDDEATITQQIDSWIAENKESAVIDRLSTISIQNNETYFLVIKSLLYIGINSTNYYSHNLVIDTVGNKFNFDSLVKNKIVSSDSEVGLFIFDNFLNKYDNPPFDFEREFIHRLLTDHKPIDNEIIGIKVDNLKQTLINYMENYINSIESFEWDVYRLYNRNFEHGNSDKANELFISLIDKIGLHKYYPNCIEREPFDKSYKIGETTKKVFGEYENFKSYIEESSDSSSQTKEFKEFYDIVELFGFTSFVRFDFENIQLRDYGSHNTHLEDQIWALFELEPDLYELLLTESDDLYKKLNAVTSLLEFQSNKKNYLFVIYKYNKFPKQGENLEHVMNVIKPYLISMGKKEEDLKSSIKTKGGRMISDSDNTYLSLKYIYPKIKTMINL